MNQFGTFRTIVIGIFSFIFGFLAYGQMPTDAGIKYGNEWIDYSKKYYKVVINKDGLYRINRSELASAGMNVNGIDFSYLRLYYMGESIGFSIGENDEYIEFFGHKHRSQLDRFLPKADSLLLNPEYSLSTDNMAYFVTTGEGPNPLVYSDIQTSIEGNTKAPQNYYLHTEKVVFSSSLYKPESHTSDGIRFSSYVPGEGYCSSLKKTNTVSIPVSKVYIGGPKAKGSIIFGANGVGHRARIYIDGEFDKEYSFSYAATRHHTFEIPTSTMGDAVELKIESVANNNDKNNISVASLTYPRRFDIEGGDFAIFHREASTDKQYIEVKGYSGVEPPIVIDPVVGQKITPVKTNSGKWAFFLEPSAESYDYYLISPEKVQTPDIKERQFVDFSAYDPTYIIVSHQDLRGTGVDRIQEYADYRSSQMGGGYDVMIAYIDQIFDQFSYGVDHYIAMKNFGNWTYQTYTNPEFMFIIGKGREYPLYRTQEQRALISDAYIPSFGYPGSDVLILSDGDTPIPHYSIGRLAAKTPQEVSNYLQKIKKHDLNKMTTPTIQDREWMKKVLHLSGGSQDIQDAIADKLKIMEDTIESSSFGANVTTFYKKSTQNIEEATSKRILNLFEEGLSLVTFFGHSAVGTFDFSLDNISNYTNYGKYPFVLSLGCYSGNLHTNANSISEEFVIQNDKGAIGFLASSGTAYLGTQFYSGRDFYDLLGDDFYGEPVGKIIKKVFEIYGNTNSDATITYLQQLTLHGDPALKILQFEVPDIIPDNETSAVKPTFVDVYEDDFEFCLDLVNIGKYYPDSIDIRFQHISSQGDIVSDTVIRDLMPAFRKQYCIVFPINRKDIVGKNTILVTVDDRQEIDEGPEGEANNELRKINGELGFDFYILNNSAIPVSPKNYAIVNNQPVTLKASTYNAFGQEQTFVFQVDTTKNFDSPLLKHKEIAGVRGVAEWPLDFVLENKKVYYWRVSPDSTTTGVGYVWESSSFVYDQGAREGWNQSHYYQFGENDFQKMSLDSSRNFLFAKNIKEIQIKNKVWQPGSPATFNIDADFQSSMMLRNLTPSLGVAVIDTFGRFVNNPPGGAYGSLNSKPYPIKTYYFKTNNQQSRLDLISFLENQIPDGYYVCIYDIFKNINSDFKVEEWAADSLVNNGVNIFNYLESQGALLVRNMEKVGYALPYGFIYQKGRSPLAEGIAEDLSDEINVREEIPGFWYEGMFRSDFIGPAASWADLEWHIDPSNLIVQDTFFVRVFGYDITQEIEVLLYDKITSNSFDISSIDAGIYPYIKIEFYSKDDVDLDPAQLINWRVYYESMGDFAINTSSNFSFYKDSIQQGDHLVVDFDLENLSNHDIGDSKIEYTFIGEDNAPIVVEKPLEGIKSQQSRSIKFDFDTRPLLGAYQLQMKVNPQNSPMELYHFNNFGIKAFYVYPDVQKPLMEVTFDGIKILDEDIVSAHPLISIKLADENKYLLLDDPGDFTVALTYPDGTRKVIDPNDPAITFFPATSGAQNVARLEYNPELTQDGTYTLEVDATDVSSNSSGDLNYVVRFRVFNKEMVSNVFNYPNPFSTSTQFIFTLTGKEEPGNILIRIMTVTGKVVREITAAELGSVHIGMNKSEYKWDGRDEYGIKLANGVYLYQVITKKLDGSDYDHFTDPTQNNTDWMFKKGFGKLVIMR